MLKNGRDIARAVQHADNFHHIVLDMKKDQVIPESGDGALADISQLRMRERIARPAPGIQAKLAIAAIDCIIKAERGRKIILRDEKGG